ncbi:cAMP-binding domain of CRP or a regulatory subunit of cAMP-dependent protein kinases [Chitinophaga sp. YR627]|nr:cAMP-binding domain of CRP or a regulatory subunit of cAMP-dependent protein kinases [Chitinophaga sp. YR627]
MHVALLQYIRNLSVTPLEHEDVALIKEAFVYKCIRKKEFLLKEGDVCRYIGFIIKGAIRQYTVDKKGNEHMQNLCIENWWTADRESFHNQTPSIYNIDAWEDTELLLLPKANRYYERVNNIPAFREMRIRLDDNNHIATQYRLHSSINHTAEHRYEDLMNRYPEFAQRFPQHIIASYIGITKETLSRIRNQSVRGKL